MNPSSKTILILGDEMVTLSLLKSTLGKQKYNIITVLNKSKFLEKVSQTQPDLILLDSKMPILKPENSAKILQGELKKVLVPIILITEKIDQFNKIRGLNIGVVDCIAKPVAIEECLTRIKVNLEIKHIKDKNDNLIGRLSRLRKDVAIASIAEEMIFNFNNLLTNIQVCSESLLKNPENVTKVLKNGNRIKKATSQITALNKKLSFIQKKFPRNSRREFSLFELFTRIKKEFEDCYGSHYSLQIDYECSGKINIVTNPELFEIVFLELLKNATKSYDNLMSRTHSIRIVAKTLNLNIVKKLKIEIIDYGLDLESGFTSEIRSGLGTGRTLVEQLAVYLGVEIKIRNDRVKGAVVEVIHPLLDST